MTAITSSLGIELQSITSLNAGQQQLSTLTEQLSSGQQHDDLADYTSDEQRRIYNISGTVGQLNSFQAAGSLITPTLKVYDTTLSNISDIVNQVQQIINTRPASGSDTASTATQLQSYMKEVEDDLNTQVNGAYIFSGNRVTTPPVGDITALPVPPTETSASTSPTLPSYDTEAAGSTTATDAGAYATQSAVVDTNYTMNYGISSDDTAFQNVVLAMRYAYAATQDPTNYNSYIAKATSLIDAGETGVQNLQAQNSANANALSTITTNQASLSSELQTQLGDIQNVDTTTVSAQISYLQTQLEASYSATAILTKLSITQYL